MKKKQTLMNEHSQRRSSKALELTAILINNIAGCTLSG